MKAGGFPPLSGGGSATFLTKGLAGFSAANVMKGVPNDLVTFLPGMTMFLIMQSFGVTPPVGELYMGCNNSIFSGPGGAGWALGNGGAPTQFFLYFFGNPGQFVQFGPFPQTSFTILAIRVKSSNLGVYFWVNGGPLQGSGAFVGPFNPPGATSFIHVGDLDGAGTDPLTHSRIVHFAILNREISDTEGSQLTCNPNGNRFVLNPKITSDATCIFDFMPSRDWNGVASSFATRTTPGAAGHTLNVTGAPSLTTISELVVPTSQSTVFDGLIAQPTTDANGYTFTIRNPQDRFGFKTDALIASVDAYSSLFSFAPLQANLGLYVNGAGQTEPAFQAGGFPEHIDLQLGAGAGKTCFVWESVQSEIALVTPPPLGGFISAVRLQNFMTDGVTVANSSTQTQGPVQKRLILAGDSIIGDFYATTPSVSGSTALIRADFPTAGTGAVTLQAVGGWSYFEKAGTQASADAFAAGLVADMNATAVNYLWLSMGTNDYAGSLATPAATQTSVARILASIKSMAAAAGIQGLSVFVQSPIQRIAPATEAANNLGSTLGAYRTAIQTATLAAGYNYVEGAAGALVTNAGIGPDGIHMNNNGESQMHVSLKGIVNY